MRISRRDPYIIRAGVVYYRRNFITISRRRRVSRRELKRMVLWAGINLFKGDFIMIVAGTYRTGFVKKCALVTYRLNGRLRTLGITLILLFIV